MARKGPLRKVEYDLWKDTEICGRKLKQHFEHLECGHEQRIPTDIYGEFSSYRRRCKQCAIQQARAADANPTLHDLRENNWSIPEHEGLEKQQDRERPTQLDHRRG